jgi:hypothetical protein
MGKNQKGAYNELETMNSYNELEIFNTALGFASCSIEISRSLYDQRVRIIICKQNTRHSI